jgi:hypothetical protein
MADINIERRNQGDQSTAVQRRRGGGLARRGAWTPTLFPLSTREFFSSGPFEMMRRFSEEMDRAGASAAANPRSGRRRSRSSSATTTLSCAPTCPA